MEDLRVSLGYERICLRYFASQIIDDRPESYQGAFLNFVINGSLGISDERKQLLDREPAKRWLGDLNWSVDETRSLINAPSLDEKFQNLQTLDIPVLLIQGDLDFSTPFENAIAQAKFLPNSHLIRIKGGTHAATYNAVGTIRVDTNRTFKISNFDFWGNDCRYWSTGKSIAR